MAKKKAKLPKIPEVEISDIPSSRLIQPENLHGGSRYDVELAEQVLVGMENGISTLKMCKSLGLSWGAIMTWLAKHKDFQEHYARARENLYAFWAENIIEQAFDETRDKNTVTTEKFDDDGNLIARIVEERSDNTAVNRDRLKVDSMKWLLSKLFPAQYGDNQKVEHTGRIDLNAIVDRANKESPEAWRVRVEQEMSERRKSRMIASG